MKPQQTDGFWLEWCIDELAQGRAVQILSNGYSMWPCIRPKDKLLISAVPFSSVQINDIIAFQRQNHIVVHRVVEILDSENGNELRTIGDSNSVDDEPIDLSNFIGKVSEVNGIIVQSVAPSPFKRRIYRFVIWSLTLVLRVIRFFRRLL